MQKKGLIIQGVGGIYEVADIETDEHFNCRARGIFRHRNIVPSAGDSVLFDTAEATVDEILERRSYLIRPPLANVDLLFITFAVKKPAPVLLSVDKLISIAEYQNIEPIIIINKADLDEELAKEYYDVYSKSGFNVLVSSTESDISDTVSSLTANKISAFAGASGVGKSTIIGKVFPEHELVTSGLSRKTERGRHTTRAVRLYKLPNGGYIADTPGFSLLDFTRFDFFRLDDLPATFRDFAPYTGKCRYADCSHTKEEECGVTEAVRNGLIEKSRHDSYIAIYNDLKNKHEW